MAARTELTVSDLRRDLPEVLHRIMVLQETFVIMKHGQEFAILSPISDPEDRERVRKRIVKELSRKSAKSAGRNPQRARVASVK